MLKHRVSNAGMHGPPAVSSGARNPQNTTAAPSQYNLPATGTAPCKIAQAPNAAQSSQYTTVPGQASQNYHSTVTQITSAADYNSPYVSPQMCTDNSTIVSNSGANIMVNNYQYSSTQQYHHSDNAYPPEQNANHQNSYQNPYEPSSPHKQAKLPMIVTSETTAREGVRILNEKYDSLGNLSSSPQKSPLGSPTSDGGQFSFTDIVMSEKYREGVTEQDLLQVDTFYRSHKSEVFVCGCLANMYYGSVKSAQSNDQWIFSATGIPLLLLDTGEHHRQRKLFIILAEKGTGFTLWREVIDNLTSYKTPNANFHTMHISKDHTKLAGLSFDDAGKAKEFYAHLERLTSDPDDELLKIGKSKKKKSVKDKKKKLKLPKKTEISQPCCFVHVTKLDRPMSESDLSQASKRANPNEISQPFNFQHVTGTPGTGNDAHSLSGSLPNMMGSKLTLTSTSSVDSGLSSEDRNSSKTSK